MTSDNLDSNEQDILDSVENDSPDRGQSPQIADRGQSP